MDIKCFFDQQTATWSYVVSDIVTRKCAIIDSVIDYNQFSGHSSYDSVVKIEEYIKEQNLSVDWLLDTHIHADHLTASSYLQKKFGGKIAIGARIKEVLNLWVPIFNTERDTSLNGSQFDVLLEDGAEFYIGNLPVKVLHTPGHTPACLSYIINNEAAFVGDSLLMPDLGTARTDFPGGSAEVMFDSVQKLYQLNPQVKIYVGHDYPPEGRGKQCHATVAEHLENNILINQNTTKSEYVKIRNARDRNKDVPKLLLPSLQYNLRAGSFGEAEDNGRCYIRIPVNAILDSI